MWIVGATCANSESTLFLTKGTYNLMNLKSFFQRLKGERMDRMEESLNKFMVTTIVMRARFRRTKSWKWLRVEAIGNLLMAAYWRVLA